MDNSILNNIKLWAKENNCPFNKIIYKIDKNFPKAFKDIINYYINSTRSNEKNIDNGDEFSINFTEDGNVYLEFLVGITRVLIIEDFVNYDYLPPAKIVKESVFLNDFSQLDNVYIERFILNIPEEYVRRFTETLTIEDMIKNITKNIINYIKYLMEERKQALDEKQIVEKLFYQESTATTNTQPTQSSTNKNLERKNDEIPFEERKQILDEFESEYEFEAQAKNTKSCYSIKVYKIKNIKYKIIMEPTEGTKYTKVTHVNKEQLSQGEAKQIVIDTLQLDRDEISQNKNITRHSHTNLEEFKKLIEYLATNNDIGIRYSTRKKIDEAEDIKKR